MHISQFAGELRCQYCGGAHGTREWPVSGDLVPFYFQKEPGNHSLQVRCPHCAQSWYVVWDQYPGQVLPLFGVAAPRMAPQPARRAQVPARSNTRLLIGFIVFNLIMVLLFVMTWTDGSGCAREVGEDLQACRLRWIGLVGGMFALGNVFFAGMYLFRRRQERRRQGA